MACPPQSSPAAARSARCCGRQPVGRRSRAAGRAMASDGTGCRREHAPVSQQPPVVEVVALARLDGGTRGAVRDGALQRVELAQCGDQLLALRRGLGQRPSGLTQQEGRHEKEWACAMRGARQIRATIAPFLCDQQWGDRGDRGCFRPQTIGTGGPTGLGMPRANLQKPGSRFRLLRFSSVSDMIGSATVFAQGPHSMTTATAQSKMTAMQGSWSNRPGSTCWQHLTTNPVRDAASNL